MSGLTDFHVFWGVAMTVAEAQSASVEEEFVTGLFGEYLAQGAPKNGRTVVRAPGRRVRLFARKTGVDR